MFDRLNSQLVSSINYGSILMIGVGFVVGGMVYNSTESKKDVAKSNEQFSGDSVQNS